MMLYHIGGIGKVHFKEDDMGKPTGPMTSTKVTLGLQSWLVQEYLSWAKEGKPDGWTGGDMVDMGIFKCDVDVMFHNNGKEVLTLSLKPIRG